MALSESIRDFVAADATLTALLVGGIYTFEQTGRNGISRMTTPDAYEAGGFLKACAIIKAADLKSGSAVRDSAAGSRQTVAIYLYDDGDNGYGAILTARDRVVTLLDRVWIDSAGWIQHSGGTENERDPKLNNAALLQIDFAVVR